MARYHPAGNPLAKKPKKVLIPSCCKTGEIIINFVSALPAREGFLLSTNYTQILLF